MTTESKSENGADLTPEQIAEDIIKQAEEQVEEQHEHGHDVISA